MRAINSRSFDWIQPINKGFSKERKYNVKQGKNRYFLKVTPIEHVNSKKLELNYLSQLKWLNINHCELIEVEYKEDSILSLYRWIYGEDLRKFADQLDAVECYRYGKEAGNILKNIHSINIDEPLSDWEMYFNQKIDKKIMDYERVKYVYPKGKYFIDYINTHRYLLKKRPQVLCHGDYHVGNMMIEQSTKQLYLIDFGSLEVGDPYEEFNRMSWNMQFSNAFSKGLIEGYFSETAPPMIFWQLMALYMCVDVISSIPWAIKKGSSECKIMIDRANEVLKWYDKFNRLIPNFKEG